MKITEVIKKDGSKVYRANIYLGVDQVTGKKVKTKVTGRTQKEVKQKATQEKIAFQKAGSTRQKASTIKNYQELANLWLESYKNTVKPNTQDNVRKLIDNHILPIFGLISSINSLLHLSSQLSTNLLTRLIEGKKGLFYIMTRYTL